MGNKLVINLTRLTQQPTVIHADGQVDSVKISPQSRVELREGMTVCERWIAINPKTVKVVDTDSIPVPRGIVVREPAPQGQPAVEPVPGDPVIDKPAAQSAVEPTEVAIDKEA